MFIWRCLGWSLLRSELSFIDSAMSTLMLIMPGESGVTPLSRVFSQHIKLPGGLARRMTSHFWDRTRRSFGLGWWEVGVLVGLKGLPKLILLIVVAVMLSFTRPISRLFIFIGGFGQLVMFSGAFMLMALQLQGGRHWYFGGLRFVPALSLPLEGLALPGFAWVLYMGL